MYYTTVGSKNPYSTPYEILKKYLGKQVQRVTHGWAKKEKVKRILALKIYIAAC